MSGTATRGDDYTLSVGSPVKIPAGQSSATVTLNALEDSDPGPGATEANQTAIMTLKAGTGYSVGTPSSATVTILP